MPTLTPTALDLARDTAAAALSALWACHQRPGPGGVSWAAIDGCASPSDYADDLVADAEAGGGGLVGAARAFLPGGEGLLPEERAALTALVSLADTLSLRASQAAAVLTLVEPDAPATPQFRMSAARRARRRGQRQTWI